LACGYGF